MSRLFSLLFCLFISLAMTVTSLLPPRVFHRYVKGDFQDFPGSENLIALFVLAFLSLWLFRNRIRQIRWSRSVFLLSAILAAFIFIGVNFKTYGTLKTIDSSGFFTNIFYLFIPFLFFYIVIFSAFDKFQNRYINVCDKATNQSFRVIALYALAIFACWLPYLVIFLPGSLPHDAFWQVNQYLGIEHFSDHHPWMSTLLIGFPIGLGRQLGGSDNAGLLLATLTFSSLEALCYAFCVSRISAWTQSKVCTICALGFFAIFPFFGAFAQAVLKDSIYTACFAVFSTLLIDFALFRKKRTFVLLVCFGILLPFFRHDGLYLAILSISALAILGCRKKWLIIAIAVLLTCAVMDRLVVRYSGMWKGSDAEMLSIPCQQMARYMKLHGAEFSDKDRQKLHLVFQGRDIGQHYNPCISDPIKGDYDNSQHANFFRIWVKHISHHPRTYLEATLHNTYGFYYPFRNVDCLNAFHFYIKGGQANPGNLRFHYVFPSDLRNQAYSTMMKLRTLPFLSLLLHPALPFWILFACISLTLFRKDPRKLAVFIPAILTFLICLASPINGHERYAFPAMAVLPQIIIITFLRFRQIFDTENSSCNHQSPRLTIKASFMNDHISERSRIWVVVPVYEDVSAASRLFSELQKIYGPRLYIIAVEDGSVRTPLSLDVFRQNVVSGKILFLKRNVGHQRALAIGLDMVTKLAADDEPIVLMDSDGEDRPESISELLHHLNDATDVVVASRKNRVETLKFKIFYVIYKWLFKILTGREISFGNFMVMTRIAAKRLTSMPELSTHIASSVLASKLRIHTVAINRGRRYAGPSKMNFISLVLHGLKALMVFAEDVLVRAGIASACIATAAVFGGILAIILKCAGFSTPGWFSLSLGILAIMLIQTGATVLMMLMLVGVVRSGSVALPLDYEVFVDHVEQFDPSLQ